MIWFAEAECTLRKTTSVGVGFFAVTVGKEGNDSFFHFLLSMSHRLLILSFGLAGGIPFWSSSCNS